jgi:hypothetical protein
MARGKTIKMGPVDEDRRDAQVHDLPERGRIEALFDQNLFRMHIRRDIRRERASAYWFAAALWGLSGLIIGGFMGSFLTLRTGEAFLPVASDAMTRGMAVEAGRRNAEESAPIISDPAAPNPPAPSAP